MSATRLFVTFMAIATGVALSSQTVRAVDGHPVLEVGGDHLFLNDADNLWFWLRNLQLAGAAGEATITVPVGFVTTLETPVGSELGAASVVVIPHSGAQVVYTGRLVVTTAGAVAAADRRDGCNVPPHAVSWRLVLTAKSGETLTIPIAVARAAGGTQLDVCLGGLVTAGSTPSALYFETSRTFRNPADTGTYALSAEIARAGAAAKGYDLVALDPVPQQLIVETGHTAAGSLTVTGALRGAGLPRRGAEVNVYGGGTTNSANWRLLGRALTKADGSFRLVHGAAEIGYVYAVVDPSVAGTCRGLPSIPAGCLSLTRAGIASPEVAVTRG